ncbi:MAG: hypothetical protein R6X11_07120 [Desulfonatronovibrio sp.]
MKAAKILTLLFILVGFCWSSAQAMCAYNKSEKVMAVNLNCGMLCENDWTLNPGMKKCRHDKGGVVYYQLIDYHDSDHAGYLEAHVQVDEHGWTTTRGQGDGLELCSKRENGSIRECMAFK